ncbi:MAG: UvrD-helicase domain-containing protein [Flavobacteriales bacterium]|jgi:ATP-dependent exoDNAse (exonuclease V) beta subunit
MSSTSSASPLTAKAPFLVLDASAGSGKTYSLVQHILMNALRPANMPGAYQKILAITFTNNAADEMKARLLKQLLEFSNEESPAENAFFKPIWEALDLSPEELQIRASAGAKHMLHNYSTLHVGTIDQFTHRLVRTFTRDLELDDNFEVRLDLDAMITEALDALYSSLGEQHELREALVALVRDRMNRDKNHNPDYDLKKEGKNSFNEDHWQYLEKLPEPKRLIEIQRELNAKISTICETGRTLSDEAQKILKDEGIEETLVHKKNVKSQILTKWRKLHLHPLDAGKNVWKSHVKGGNHPWEEFLAKAKRFEDENQHALILLKEATSKLQNLAATKALLVKFEELQKSQNTMPLSAFNKLIAEELEKEPAAFIYARLGEKYWHFYIDEFQDTSVVQFNNLHPLIEHSLTKDEHSNSALIVGDAKQSIYRWRGGKAEQFMKLVDNEHLINRFEGHPEGHELYARDTLRLERNFRTHGAIVNFNNALFSSLNADLGLETHKEVYSKERVHQTPHKNEDQGEVRVDVLEADNANELKDIACEKTVERIEELASRGHAYSDIAILVRGNADGKRIANFLTQKGYPVLSADSLVLSNAHEGRLIHAASKLYLNQLDKEARFALAHALVRQGKIPADKGFAFERAVVDKGVGALISEYPLAAQLLAPAESLFDFAVRTFDIFGYLDGANAMVDASLDLIYEFQSREGTFATLPAWWEEQAKKKNVEAPESTPSIKVMTIHKSKGLEFEHVIVPFDINFKPDSSEQWLDFPLHDELEKMPITYKDDHKELFETEQILELDTKDRFDWINMVYVTLTRPVSGLHLLLKGGEKPGHLAKAVLDNLALSYEAQSWSYGTIVAPSTNEESIPKAIVAAAHTTMSALEVKMALTAPEKWYEGGADARKWGTALHRLLQYPKELRQQGLQRLYRSGEFSKPLHERAASVLERMNAKEALQSLEKEGTVVYTERSIINGTETLRPDLIIESEQKLMVIDYKTGVPKEKDQAQLREYIELLSAYFENVDGALLYI